MKHWAGREEARLEMTRSQTIGESQHVAVVVIQNVVKLENPSGWKSWLRIIARNCGERNPTHHFQESLMPISSASSPGAMTRGWQTLVIEDEMVDIQN